MASGDMFSVFWSYWLLLPLQHDISVPFLSQTGGDTLCGEDSRLHHYASVWDQYHSCILNSYAVLDYFIPSTFYIGRKGK